MSRVEIGLEISRKKVEKKPQSQVYLKTKRETKPELKSIYSLSVEL